MRLRWRRKLIFQVISEKEVTHGVMQRGRRFHGVRVWGGDTLLLIAAQRLSFLLPRLLKQLLGGGD